MARTDCDVHGRQLGHLILKAHLPQTHISQGMQPVEAKAHLHLSMKWRSKGLSSGGCFLKT